MSSCDELDSDKLPTSLEDKVRELLDTKKSTLTKSLMPTKGSADFLNYKITLSDGKKAKVIECNELGMDSDVKSLVSYIQKNSEKK